MALKLNSPFDIPIGSLKPPPSRWPEELKGKRSAVCFLFIPGETPVSEPQIVLTKRTILVSTHKGQIGFPGGIAEEGDDSPAATALRELEEELGIPATRIRVHGILASFSALGRFPVFPVVCSTAFTASKMRPSVAEVAEIITAPWSAFKPENSKPFSFMLFGQRRKSHLFALTKHNVWGLTAQMLFDANLGHA